MGQGKVRRIEVRGQREQTPTGDGAEPGVKRRPLGATVIGVLLILWGAQMLYGALVSIPPLLHRIAVEQPNIMKAEVLFWWRIRTIPLILAVIWFIVGVGLLRLKRWARLLTPMVPVLIPLWLFIELLANRVSSLAFPSTIAFWIMSRLTGFVFLVWGGVTGWYFLRPSVKAQFK